MGSVVVANAWAIARDPANYDDPLKFNPERFLKRGELDPANYVFGFGRRCVSLFSLKYVMTYTIFNLIPESAWVLTSRKMKCGYLLYACFGGSTFPSRRIMTGVKWNRMCSSHPAL